MLRNHRLFLEDMFTSIKRIREYVAAASLEELLQDQMRLDAVIRNFEIIGVAANNVPQQLKEKYPEVEWRKISDFRNVLAHGNFGIDYDIMWEIIQDKLPVLQGQIQKILESDK